MTMGLPTDRDGYDVRLPQCRHCGSRGCVKDACLTREDDPVARLTEALATCRELREYDRADNARLQADKVILQDALTRRTDLAIQQDAKIERLRAAIAWTREVRPGKNKESGGAIVYMTWDQFNAMRALADAALKDTTP